MKEKLRITLLIFVICIAVLIMPVTAKATGEQIAFTSDRDGHNEIYVMNTDGTGQTRLTYSDPSGNSDGSLYPAWSPDAQKILFASSPSVAFSGISIPEINYFTMNPDGTGKSQLTYVDWMNDYASVVEGKASWSPDGSKIGCDLVVGTSYATNIFVMNIADGTWTSIDGTADGTFYPDWSPDGTKILFMGYSYFDGIIYMTGIQTMNATDGTGHILLLEGSHRSPVYSPDGKKIAFSSNMDGDYEIYVMNADGSGVKRLTNNAASDKDPSWSSDGNTIVFSSDRDGNYEIYSMNKNGNHQVRLTDNTADDFAPDWSPSQKAHGKVK